MTVEFLLTLLGELYAQLRLKEQELASKDSMIEQLRGEIFREKKHGTV